jgi:hypothetical protein
VADHRLNQSYFHRVQGLFLAYSIHDVKNVNKDYLADHSGNNHEYNPDIFYLFILVCKLFHHVADEEGTKK